MNENPIIPEKNDNLENENLQNNEVIEDINSTESTSSNDDNVLENINTIEPDTKLELPKESVEVSEIQNVNIPQTKPRKSKKGLIIGLIIIILVAFVLAFGFFYITNPKKILASNLSKMYNNILNLQEENKILSNILNSKKIGMTSDIKIKLNDSQNITKDFNNIGLNLDYRENKEKKEGYLELNSTLKDKKLISLETILKNNKAYIKLKDIMDKYYFTEYEFISLLNNQNNEDYIYLLDIVKKNIITEFEKEELKTENVNEKINNKDEKLQKISLEIKEQLLNKIALGILQEVKNDDKSINIIITNFKISKEDLLDTITELINSINETTTNEVLFTYNMYVKNYNEVLKQEIYTENNKIQVYSYDNTIEFKRTYMQTTNCISSHSSLSINCSDNEPIEKTALQLKIIGDKTSGEITGIIADSAIITGKYTNNSLDLTLSDSMSSSNEINLKMDYTGNEISNSEYQYDMNIVVSAIENNKEIFKVEINMDSKITSDVEIPSIKISNSKEINLMTEEEQNEIINKIMEIPVIQELIVKNS